MKVAKLIAAGGLCLLVSLWLTVFGWGEELNGADDPALLSFRRSLTGMAGSGQTASSQAASKEHGVRVGDLLKGNGTRAGYVLSQSAIVHNSEIVSVDGSSKRRNKDYYLDYANGTLMFVEPVKTNQLIRVTYRHIPGKGGERSVIGSPTLSLNIGQRTAMGITYAYRTGLASGQDAFDLLTCGLNLTTSLGGKSSMENMFYYSSPKDSGRLSLDALRNGERPNNTQKPKSDKMLLHSADLELGRMSVKLSFQEIGAGFSGFASLRDQGVAPPEVLRRLEKEKGLRRLGMQFGYDLGRSASTGIEWNRIGDKGGDIVRQSFTIGSDRLKFNATLREIDQGFTRFKDLAEAERKQWAKEKGMKRSNYELSLAPLKGMSADAPWNALSWGEISDQSGKLSLRALNFTSKRFGLTATETKVDPGFKRLGSLTGGELASMALRIRQQFDPDAAPKSVKKNDLKHIGAETGIHRRNIRTDFGLGSTTASLQFLDVDDGSSGVSRQSFAFEGASYKVLGTIQEIDEGFDKLLELAPAERKHFANEYGMRRANLSGDFTLKPGLDLSTSFERVSTKDAGLVKYGTALAGSKFDLKANYQDIDPEFDRVMDLADADKKKMAVEQGMKRWDLTLGLHPTKALSIDSFFYDGKHSTEDRFKRQLRNKIDFNPSRGPKITLLRDEVRTGASDAASRSIHETYKLDHNIGVSSLGTLSFKSMLDTKTNIAPDGTERWTRTTTYHLNSDRRRPLSFAADWKTIEREDGRFEKTRLLSIGSKLSGDLAFNGMRKVVETDEHETVAQDYGLTGKVLGGLSFSARFGEMLLDGVTVGKVRKLILTPPGAKDYGIFKGVGWNLKFEEVRKGSKTQTQTKAAKVESTLLKHRLAVGYSGAVTKKSETPIVRSFSIAGDQDPKKRLHYDFSYKVRDPGAGPSLLIRRYNADLRISPTTKLEYKYFSFNEKKNGKLELVGREFLKLTSSLNKRLSLLGQYEVADNYKQDSTKRTISLGIAGKPSSLAAVEVSYGYDREEIKGRKASTRTYKVKYDYTIDADHFVAISGQYTDWKGHRPADNDRDDLRLQLDFMTLFN